MRWLFGCRGLLLCGPSAARETPVLVSSASGRELFALRGTRRGGLEVEVLRGLEVQRLVISTDIVANKM